MLVCDASSLILLTKADLIDQLLKEDEIIISFGIYEEVVIKGIERDYQDAYTIKKYVDKGLIKRRKPSIEIQSHLEKTFGLKKGEKEAIALAIEVGEKRLLCDDKRGINVCRILGVKVIVAMDICIALYQKGIISLSKAKESFKLLREFGWYSDKIIQQREVLLR